ncbi:MAG: DUF885 domain-containing protein [Acidimicrobiales bacterium]
MAQVRELAERAHSDWLAAHPFQASGYGIPGYDDQAPDDSEAGDAARRSQLEASLTAAGRLDTSELSLEDSVTLGCVVEDAAAELAALDSKALEHTVSAMPYSGPAVLMATAARTILIDPGAAADYLARLRGGAGWIDRLAERLQLGARSGRTPVAPLVDKTITWAEELLGPPSPLPLSIPDPPAGWDRAASWRDERDAVAAEIVKPAIARWVEVLRELRPLSRPAERPGLCFLPGGEGDYARAIRAHTTLPLSAEQIHQTGLDHIATLESRVVELGEKLGLGHLEEIHEALRASAGRLPPEESIGAAVGAIRRAEAGAAKFFTAPLPAPCAVTPMPTVVGVSGAAPHYTPPRLDGARPGTFWFNVDLPTAGTGYDLESVAFHEAVPGHHLQIARLQLLVDLPASQRQRYTSVFSEGWALYAEQLAEEMGLYNSTEALLGAMTASLMRAARLVIDTGLHAFGWSGSRALDFYRAHVPLPVEFLSAEIDRYITWPGQALAYLTGKLEILRLREEAEARLGDRFALPQFHAAVLDSGSLPMPVLGRNIGAWIDRAGSAPR